jgi:hypothetical protein
MASLVEHTIPIDNTTQVQELNIGRLAPELRDAIYRYALIRRGDESIDLISGSFDDLALGLLRVSSAIRHEAMQIFFGANTFRIDCTGIDRSHLETQMRKLSNISLGLIRRFKFSYRHTELEIPFQNTRSLNPRSLEARCQRETSIGLNILPRSPFYIVTRVPYHACETSDAFSAVTYFLEDLISYRRIRRLAVMDVLDVACFVDRCGALHSRVLAQRQMEHDLSP